MSKSKQLRTQSGDQVKILSEHNLPLEDILKSNRHISPEDEKVFFEPSLDDLHDPFLMPDMELAVKRILEAREKKERVVVFGDYDVDGVSSTAILYKFFREIGIECSYRLPHRVHDGYGLKKYFFDELAEKQVKLVVTVDCGTRDIEVIEYAKSLGIDVIVTDHHAVPERIPEWIPILNPKRTDSKYPFPSLAGAGVAFKLIHWLILSTEWTTQKLQDYIDLASLGTVADCMPLVGENRTITVLGLRQMKESKTSALRKYIENLDKEVEWDADIIGFQIWPRINAAGRMDSPLKALHWLLAEEEKVDAWLEEIESLNMARQEKVKFFTEDALSSVDTDAPVLFYLHEQLEHGLVGLVAGKLTEQYGKPAIVLCPHHSVKSEEWTTNGEVKKREYEKEATFRHSEWSEVQWRTYNASGQLDSSQTQNDKNPELVASCRSPEWCHLVELLDACKDFFVRYGGHRQAAGFTIEAEKLADFQRVITEKFSEKYGNAENLPKKTINVECTINPESLHLKTLKTIDRFRPFGIGNPKPLFLLQDVTITECRTIGSEWSHLSLRFSENPEVKLLYWKWAENKSSLEVGNIVSLVIELDRNEWNGKVSVQGVVRELLL